MIIIGILTIIFAMKYAKFMLNIFGYKSTLTIGDHDITYGRHPMSDSDYDSDSDSDYDSDYDSEYEDTQTCAKEKEIPCYMKDFYEETTLSTEWLKNSDTKKKKILDEEIETYMNRGQRSLIREHFKNITC